MIPLANLAEMLKCDLLEAAEFQRKTREGILPYLYSKQPLAVAMSGKVASFHMMVPLPGGGTVTGPQAIIDLLAATAADELHAGFDPHAGGEIARVEAPKESDDETTT